MVYGRIYYHFITEDRTFSHLPTTHNTPTNPAPPPTPPPQPQPPPTSPTRLADDKLKFIFLNENDRIPIRISLQFFSRCQIDNTQGIVQFVAWGRRLTQFTNIYMRH